MVLSRASLKKEPEAETRFPGMLPFCIEHEFVFPLTFHKGRSSYAMFQFPSHKHLYRIDCYGIGYRKYKPDLLAKGEGQ